MEGGGAGGSTSIKAGMVEDDAATPGQGADSSAFTGLGDLSDPYYVRRPPR